MKSYVSLRTRNILLAIALVFAAGWYVATVLSHLYIEFKISTSGKEVPAKVLKVETMERDDGDKIWTVDLINYSFEIPEGYVFTGVNEANSSQTKELIGVPDETGVYRDAKVEYVPRNPERNRLKGWGYDGYGPPGGYGNFAIRFALHFALLFAAIGYAYHLLSNVRNEPAVVTQPKATVVELHQYNPRQEFLKLWTAAVDASNYDKSAWQNVEKQLNNADIF